MDARGALPQVDGLGTYVRQVVPQLCAAGERAGTFRTTLLVHPALESFWRASTPRAIVVPSTVRPMHIAQNWQIPWYVRRLRPDLFFYPGHDPPLLLRTPLVCTVHDVTLFHNRPYFERFDRTKLGYLKVVTPTGLRRARAILTVSNHTRREIGETFGEHLLPKVHVTPNGIVAPPVRHQDTAAEKDRFLYVGTDRPHKNLPRVIEAYAIARRQAPDLPRLEVVGGIRMPTLLNETIQRAGVGAHVVLRGYLSEADLEACYAHAVALVFPSIAEGFGLPILEAMVRSVPVITSNGTACAEVAGNAALTVNPLDVDEIARGMLRLFRESTLRTELVRKGHDRASEFTWERTASRTFDVVEDCLRRLPAQL